ncbi:hypothetical protein C900_00582 [Fulvivirga imtechensis AK7]|uniref:Uncharacterized protein n=1 Tax=Fulvivirga imtechensis AK7 TaxID=1237149 RepID=L8JLC7_9BACT|nr:hypothetical protein C900_00582 [Fulvivirga imtechensis AK7]
MFVSIYKQINCAIVDICATLHIFKRYRLFDRKPRSLQQWQDKELTRAVFTLIGKTSVKFVYFYPYWMDESKTYP